LIDRIATLIPDAGEVERLLRDAGAIIVVNEGGAGARVEIRFSDLRDAQQLHKTLVETRALQSLAGEKEGEDGNIDQGRAAGNQVNP
jgi:hypothetical protein